MTCSVLILLCSSSRYSRAPGSVAFVLGFPAREAARILDTSTESVTSALKRAWAALDRHQRSSGQRAPAPPPNSATERQLVDRLTRAFETADVAGIVAILTEDAWLTMPPLPLEYQGRELAARSWSFH
jgi:hypothetical protein